MGVRNLSDQDVVVRQRYDQPPDPFADWRVKPGFEVVLSHGSASSWLLEVFDPTSCQVLARWLGDDRAVGVVVGADLSVSFFAGMNRVPAQFLDFDAASELHESPQTCASNSPPPSP
jgi:hypothetical protein